MDLTLIFLFIILVALMIIAYKILKIIIQTIIIAILSGVFYVVLANSGFHLAITITNVFFFMVNKYANNVIHA